MPWYGVYLEGVQYVRVLYGGTEGPLIAHMAWERRVGRAHHCRPSRAILTFWTGTYVVTLLPLGIRLDIFSFLFHARVP